MQKIGLIAIWISFGLWGVVAIVSISSLTISQKAISIPILLLISEIAFWLGVVVVGKTVADRYRKQLDPRRLWKAIKKFWCRWF
jgi:spore maturation protein SpmA